jgi:hypothetical protein
MKRHELSGHGSRSLFTATAKRVHPRNGMSPVMRGGIRF